MSGKRAWAWSVIVTVVSLIGMLVGAVLESNSLIILSGMLLVALIIIGNIVTSRQQPRRLGADTVRKDATRSGQLFLVGIVIALVAAVIGFVVGGLTCGFHGALLGTISGFLVFGILPVDLQILVRMSKGQLLVGLGFALSGAMFGFIAGALKSGWSGGLIGGSIGFLAFGIVCPIYSRYLEEKHTRRVPVSRETVEKVIHKIGEL